MLRYGKRPVNNKCKKNIAGIQATKTGEILHTDITYIKTTDNKINYLSFVEDNFSKFILLGKVSQNPNADFIKDNISTVVLQYGLMDKRLQLIVDGGSENKGQLDLFLNTEGKMITKIVARVDIPFANNVVEVLHKKFKNEFLQGNSLINYTELTQALPALIEKYNNQYHDSLYGYSPQEVWNGAIPNKNRFKGIFVAANEKEN